MITKKKNEEEIKTSLKKKLEEITKVKRENIVLIKKKANGKKINITTKYNIKKFGFASGQFIQMLIGPDLRFSQEKICICVGVNLWGKRRLWFLTEESDGITFFINPEEFSLIQEEGNLIVLDSPKKQ